MNSPGLQFSELVHTTDTKTCSIGYSYSAHIFQGQCIKKNCKDNVGQQCSTHMPIPHTHHIGKQICNMSDKYENTLLSNIIRTADTTTEEHCLEQ